MTASLWDVEGQPLTSQGLQGYSTELHIKSAAHPWSFRSTPPYSRFTHLSEARKVTRTYIFYKSILFYFPLSLGHRGRLGASNPLHWASTLLKMWLWRSSGDLDWGQQIVIAVAGWDSCCQPHRSPHDLAPVIKSAAFGGKWSRWVPGSPTSFFSLQLPFTSFLFLLTSLG